MKINSKIFSSYTYDLGGWFRLFGYGLHWKHKTEPVLFSERYGHTKYLKIGSWKFKIIN